jgi:hypothetical protein
MTENRIYFFLSLFLSYLYLFLSFLPYYFLIPSISPFSSLPFLHIKVPSHLFFRPPIPLSPSWISFQSIFICPSYSHSFPHRPILATMCWVPENGRTWSLFICKRFNCPLLIKANKLPNRGSFFSGSQFFEVPPRSIWFIIQRHATPTTIWDVECNFYTFRSVLQIRVLSSGM